MYRLDINFFRISIQISIKSKQEKLSFFHPFFSFFFFVDIINHIESVNFTVYYISRHIKCKIKFGFNIFLYRNFTQKINYFNLYRNIILDNF